VLGIGVNVAVDVAALPPEAAAVAGTLGRDPSEIDATLFALLSALETRLSESKVALLDALRERDALLGKPVRWDGGEGIGAGIDDRGGLLVHLPDGTTTTLNAGEVTLSV
jgi:BirA family biotin operon repressor/biotin-[acetyl-CoA-carboxylase] ligase